VRPLTEYGTFTAIAELLFNPSTGSGHRIRYIEGWNTGILRMRRWMREHGLPEPVFEEIGQTFRVTFHGPGDNILDLIPEEGVTDLRTLGLNERQIEALRLMVNERYTFTNREYCQQSVSLSPRPPGTLADWWRWGRPLVWARDVGLVTSLFDEIALTLMRFVMRFLLFVTILSPLLRYRRQAQDKPP
jgi:hypothetical protein